jgi:hypothetical protein
MEINRWVRVGVHEQMYAGINGVGGGDELKIGSMVLQDDAASGIILLLLDLDMNRITSAITLHRDILGERRIAYKAGSGGNIKHFLNTFTSQRTAFYVRTSADI